MFIIDGHRFLIVQAWSGFFGPRWSDWQTEKSPLLRDSKWFGDLGKGLTLVYELDFR